MDPALEDLLLKVKAIAQGPDAALLRQVIDDLYEQGQPQEQYDEEPLAPEELAAIEEAEEAKRRGDKEYFMMWEDVKKALGK